MNDNSLPVERLQEGSEQALAEAMTQFSVRLQQIVALRMDPRLSRRFDATDVLQEAFLEARKRLSRYFQEPAVPLFVWLRGVVLDTLADFHCRHLGARMRDATQEVYLQCPVSSQASSVALVALLAGDFTSPSQAAIRGETAAQVERLLSRMDSIDREVLILRHLEELTNDEVAAALGVKKAAASRRYMRALARFREVLLTIPETGS
jgi:RNA polymerase sigma-70 factor (ECF subfamily)